jgi:predicted DNA-binding protein (UPF0251 family)
MGKIRRPKKKNGRPSTYDALTYEDIGLMRWLAAQGKTQSEIAKYYGVCGRTFRRWMEKKDEPLSWKIKQAVLMGQLIYGKPTTDLTLCLLDELDRWDHEWDRDIGITHEFDLYTGWYESQGTEKITASLIHCFGHDPDTPQGSKVWALLYELTEIHDALRNLHQIAYHLHKTESWSRYMSKEPLRWDLLRDAHNKVKENLREQGSDKTSQSPDVDVT